MEQAKLPDSLEARKIYRRILIDGAIAADAGSEEDFTALAAENLIKWYPKSKAARKVGAWKPIHWPKKFRSQLEQYRERDITLISPRLLQVRSPEIGGEIFIGIQRVPYPDPGGCPICGGTAHGDGGEKYRCTICHYRWTTDETAAPPATAPTAPPKSGQSRIDRLRKLQKTT